MIHRRLSALFLPHLLRVLPLVVLCSSCQPESDVAPPPLLAETPSAPNETVSPSIDDKSADDIFENSPAPDLDGFGSDEPSERLDLPQRGVVRIGTRALTHSTMAHWEQFDCTTFETPRPGWFRVRLTYTARNGNVPIQMKIGELRLKKNLPLTSEPAMATLGRVEFSEKGSQPFALYTPATPNAPHFEIQEVAFIPTAVEDQPVAADENGQFVLTAAAATPWGDTLQYESSPEKQCLGFWKDPDDFVEWELLTSKPGCFVVTITLGCAQGEEGSQAALRMGKQTLPFTVESTGGFQEWKDFEIGTLDIAKSGLHRLLLRAQDKKGKAIMDVQKVTLRPAGS